MANAFLVELENVVAALDDPDAIAGVAVSAIIRHLHVSRAHYGEVDGDAIVVRHGRGAGVEAMAGRYPFAAFGAVGLADYRAGRTVVCRDAGGDPSINEATEARMTAAGVAAYVGVPLLDGGRLAALLAVHAATPHGWTVDDVATLEAAAATIWRAIAAARRGR